MKRALFSLLVLLVVTASGCNENLSVVAPDARIQKLASGFDFTEGPVADAHGNVFFTDIPNSRIHKWSPDGSVSTFFDQTGEANGLYFDTKGNLLACQGGARKLVSIDTSGKVTTLADKYDGKKLNSPNDLWLDPKGGIYFTDPRYGPRHNLEQDGEHVYYLSPDRKKVIRVADDMVRPNGIIGTPDGKKLYIADLDSIQNRGDHLKEVGAIRDLGYRIYLDPGIGGAGDLSPSMVDVDCIVVGTETLQSLRELRTICRIHPHVVVSLDYSGESMLARDRSLMGMGTKNLVGKVCEAGASEIIYLDLKRVGTSSGTGSTRMEKVLNSSSIPVLVGGGIRNAEDIEHLGGLGADGVLVATCIHNGVLTSEDIARLTS